MVIRINCVFGEIYQKLIKQAATTRRGGAPPFPPKGLAWPEILVTNQKILVIDQEILVRNQEIVLRNQKIILKMHSNSL